MGFAFARSQFRPGFCRQVLLRKRSGCFWFDVLLLVRQDFLAIDNFAPVSKLDNTVRHDVRVDHLVRIGKGLSADINATTASFSSVINSVISLFCFYHASLRLVFLSSVQERLRIAVAGLDVTINERLQLFVR